MLFAILHKQRNFLIINSRYLLYYYLLRLFADERVPIHVRRGFGLPTASVRLYCARASDQDEQESRQDGTTPQREQLCGFRRSHWTSRLVRMVRGFSSQ